MVARVPEKGTMYLGLEHSTTRRESGYVLVGLGEALRNALKEDDIRNKVPIEQ